MLLLPVLHEISLEPEIVESDQLFFNRNHCLPSEHSPAVVLIIIGWREMETGYAIKQSGAKLCTCRMTVEMMDQEVEGSVDMNEGVQIVLSESESAARRMCKDSEYSY